MKSQALNNSRSTDALKKHGDYAAKLAECGARQNRYNDNDDNYDDNYDDNMKKNYLGARSWSPSRAEP